MSKKFDIKSTLSKIKIEYLVVIALIVVVLLFFTSSFNYDSNSEQSVESYVDSLETKLEKSLAKVKGSGKVEVIISVKGGMEQVYATEKKEQNGNVVETPVLVNGKTVLITEKYPEITGVVIVCEGAKNLSCKVNIINAVCVYLNVDESKIEVLAMN